MEKLFPTRQCISCGIKKDKKQLVRIVKNKSGIISVDANASMDGRGAYICPDAKCVEMLTKKRGLDRAFRTHIAEIDYERISKELSEIE